MLTWLPSQLRAKWKLRPSFGKRVEVAMATDERLTHPALVNSWSWAFCRKRWTPEKPVS